jgi:hypothetical protein
MTDTEELRCPRDGRPIDRKYIGKWDDKTYLAFCHCGYVHELVTLEKQKSEVTG